MEKNARLKTAARAAANPAEPAAEAGLDAEIGMLREALRQAARDDYADLTVGERMRVLDTVSKAAARLATLLKARRHLAENQDMGVVLNRALREVLEELGRSK